MELPEVPLRLRGKPNSISARSCTAPAGLVSACADGFQGGLQDPGRVHARPPSPPSRALGLGTGSYPGEHGRGTGCPALGTCVLLAHSESPSTETLCGPPASGLGQLGPRCPCGRCGLSEATIICVSLKVEPALSRQLLWPVDEAPRLLGPLGGKPGCLEPGRTPCAMALGAAGCHTAMTGTGRCPRLVSAKPSRSRYTHLVMTSVLPEIYCTRTHTRMHAMYFFYFCAVVKHTRQKIHHSNRFQASSSAAPSTSTLSGSCPHRHLRNFLVLPN